MLFLAAKMCEAVRLKALERMVDMLSRDRAELHLPRIIAPTCCRVECRDGI